MTQQPAQRPIAECWATSNQAPLWIAVALYAVAQADPTTGLAPMRPGQLLAAVAPGGRQDVLSKAIRRAVVSGWLHPDSTAWCLRLAVQRGT